jgi:hypothetical protein
MPKTTTPRKRKPRSTGSVEVVSLTHQDMLNWVSTLNDLAISNIIDEDKTTPLSNEPVMKNLFEEHELLVIKGKIFTLLEWIKVSNGTDTDTTQET